MKRTTFLILLLTSLHRIPVARAELVPDLARYFERKITSVETAVCSEPGPETEIADSSDEASMVFQDVNIDITPSVTIGISKVFSLSISPEIDMVFVPVLLQQPDRE